MKIITGLKLVAMATVIASVSRELFHRIDYFFTNLLLLSRAVKNESLSKIQILSFHPIPDAYKQLLFAGPRSAIGRAPDS